MQEDISCGSGRVRNCPDYLGVDTEVVEYHNSTLFTFDRTNTEGDANIAVVAGNMKHHGHGDLKRPWGFAS